MMSSIYLTDLLPRNINCMYSSKMWHVIVWLFNNRLQSYNWVLFENLDTKKNAERQKHDKISCCWKSVKFRASFPVVPFVINTCHLTQRKKPKRQTIKKATKYMSNYVHHDCLLEKQMHILLSHLSHMSYSFH